MEQDRGKLPSFKSLNVIAAVVRHQSFTAASHELHVTPSAVSKQVAQIESWLGQSLFDRLGGVAMPRPEACRLAQAVDQANGLLFDAVAAIRPEPPHGTLRVAVPATFAMRWLIPRLWTFSSRHPGITVDVIQTHAREDLASINYDVAIRPGPPFPPKSQPRQVLCDALGLVMSPKLLRSRRLGPNNLLSWVTFLESESRPGELDRWLKVAGPPTHQSNKRRQFPHFYIALEAAMSGEGALVAPIVTLADLIKRGLLCEPFESRRLTTGHIVAFGAPGRKAATSSNAFLGWLERTATQAPRCEDSMRVSDNRGVG